MAKPEWGPPTPYTAGMYTLWDVESGNLTEEFPTLAAALAAIRDDVVELGRQDAEAYVLFRETADQPRVIAEGADLVNLALRSGLVHPSTSASGARRAASPTGIHAPLATGDAAAPSDAFHRRPVGWRTISAYIAPIASRILSASAANSPSGKASVPFFVLKASPCCCS
jgi:hypothetical protein